MPQLWSLLAANFGIPNPFSQAELRALRLGVERSDAAPLTLIIYFEYARSEAYIPEGLIGLLRSCSRRWQYIHLQDPPYAPMQTLVLDLPAPCLEEFMLSRDGPPENLAPAMHWLQFVSMLNAPRLNAIDIRWPKIDFVTLCLPWAQLTFLALCE